MIVPKIDLANNGLAVSRIVAGMMRLMEWNLSSEQLLGWIEAVMDMGITTFDHADIYGGYRCEGEFGRALALKPALRDRMELVTKCDIMLVAANRPQNTVHHYDTTRAHIIGSAENSLRELRTDRIDLLLIHRPDPLMDADEVAQALYELRQAGKVRFFGVSNFMPWQFNLLQSRLDFPLITNQIELSPLYLNPLHDGTLDLCQQRRIVPMAWSPVGGGGLFIPYDARSQRLHAKLLDLSRALNVGIDQVALAWVMMHPTHPVPVIGSGKLERVRAAADAVNVKLSRQDWFGIWEASNGHEVP